MNKTNLYSLSKDELVYLISTIQSDLAIQLEKSKETIKDILNINREHSYWTSIEKCSFDGCHRFFFFNESYNMKCIEHYNDGRITFCSCLRDGCECDKNADKGIGWWCQEHIPENYLVIDDKNFSFVCYKCISEGHYEDNM